MPKFIVEIECDNVAFVGNLLKETGRIVESVADTLLLSKWFYEQNDQTLYDINGNVVGKAYFSD